MSSRRGHNEGSIYRRESDGRWAAVLDMGWEDGKRKRKHIYGKTRQEVQRKLTLAKVEFEKTGSLPQDDMTMNALFAEWLTAVKSTIRPSTLVSYEEIVRLHLKPTLGRTRVARLEARELQALMAEKEANGLSPRRVQYIRAIARIILNYAVEQRIVSRNVATHTKPPRVSKPEIVPMTTEEAEAFLATVKGERLEALYILALSLGMRRGELLGLRWSDVDFERKRLTIRQTLQRSGGGGLALVEPKSDKSRRSLPLPNFVLQALKDHRAGQVKERLKVGPEWQDSGHVFVARAGGLLDPANVSHHFKRRLKKAGLREMRFHDLRHSCASFLLDKGAPMLLITDILGHSHVSFTMHTYAHLQPSASRVAADIMDDLFGRA